MRKSSSASLRPLTPRSRTPPSTICECCANNNMDVSSEDLLQKVKSMSNIQDELSLNVKLYECGHCVCEKCLRQSIKEEYAAKNKHITCPVDDCSTELTDVVLLSLVPLPMYITLLRRQIDEKIDLHPLWQRCPGQKCQQAIRVNGASVLEEAIVVQCSCSAVWCFQCKAAAHWPASCTGAKDFRKTTSTYDGFLADCSQPIIRYQCSNCKRRKNNMSSVAQPSVSELETSLGCQCVFEICEPHLNVSGSHLTPSVSLTQVMSVTESPLLTLLFYHSALYHSRRRSEWNWQRSEVKANMLAQAINRQTSRGPRTLSLHPDTSVSGTMVPTPPTTPRPVETRRMAHHLKPVILTEKLLLSLVLKFMYQVHFLLSNVYVALLSRSSMDCDVREITEACCRLETVSSVIYKVFDELDHKPCKDSLIQLRQLKEDGEKLLKWITIKSRLLQSKQKPPEIAINMTAR